MFKKLFLRKRLSADVVDVEDGHHGLKRHLGWIQLVTIGIGAIVGAGIFVITGTAAAQYAGPGIVLSLFIAAAICVLAGLCYAELSSLIPSAGGSYAYAYVALGELPAWMIGWSVTGQYIMSIATVAVGWSGYLRSFLRDWGLKLPAACSSSPFQYEIGQGWKLSGSLIDLPAVLLLALMGIMVSIGIKAAARFNSLMVVIKLCTVVLFILIGLPYVNTGNWFPFIPENTGHFGNFGFSGILRAAGLLFFAYIGFDTVATLAQEAKNPQKDLPRGILGSLLLSASLYVILAAVLTGVVSYTLLDVPDPIAIALNAMGPSFFWVASVVKVAILAALASVSLVQLLGQSRTFMAIGKDGLLPKFFSRLNKKTQTPVTGSLITAVATMILAGLFPVEILGQLVCIMTLFIYGVVCLGVWILRHTHPEFKRTFKVPFVPWIPLLGILACFGQMFVMPGVTWLQFMAWLGLGLLIYFGYSVKNSKIRRTHTAARD